MGGSQFSLWEPFVQANGLPCQKELCSLHFTACPQAGFFSWLKSWQCNLHRLVCVELSHWNPWLALSAASLWKKLSINCKCTVPLQKAFRTLLGPPWLCPATALAGTFPFLFSARERGVFPERISLSRRSLHAVSARLCHHTDELYPDGSVHAACHHAPKGSAHHEAACKGFPHECPSSHGCEDNNKSTNVARDLILDFTLPLASFDIAVWAETGSLSLYWEVRIQVS